MVWITGLIVLLVTAGRKGSAKIAQRPQWNSGRLDREET